jgi:hypothetical protein
MNKRVILALVFAPVALLGLLLFFSHSIAANGDRRVVSPAMSLFLGTSETEPNDTIYTANEVEVNLTMTGTIPIVQPSDIDWYRLAVPSANLGRDFRATMEDERPELLAL